MRSLLATFIMILSASLLLAEKPKKKWEVGTLVDTQLKRVHVGDIGTVSISDDAYDKSGTIDSRPIYRGYQTYIIQTPTHVYRAVQTLRWRWSKPASVTVNGPIEFRINEKKTKIWVKDDRGKVRRFDLDGVKVRTVGAGKGTFWGQVKGAQGDR